MSDPVDRAIRLYLRERSLRRLDHPEWWALSGWKRLWYWLVSL